MEENKFEQFHYHDDQQANKNIDGIVLIPKKNISDQNINKEILNENTITKDISFKPIKKLSQIIIAFSLIFLFSILPIRILESGSNMNAKAKESFDGLGSVYESIKNNDYDTAKNNLLIINKNINEINKELDDMGQKNIFISRFSPIKESSINDERFFGIVLSLSRIGNKIIDDLKFVGKINISDINNPQKESDLLFKDLEKINTDLEYIGSDFENLKLSIKKIDIEEMNDNEKKYFLLIKENIDELEKYYNSTFSLTANATKILGKNYDKKYLLLFQNNTEIRATGGFIGTYGILTLRDGKIKNIFIDSIYNPDGQISKLIEPPEPLKKITDNLAMRDSNWYPDFPTSAKNISSIYELEGGFTPDGIIAFDTKIFLDLLEIIGPVTLTNYDVEINKQNFIDITQFKTSVDYDHKENNPKKFLADLAPILLEKISMQDESNQKKIISALINNIQEKHIQFYSPEKSIQNAFVDLDIAGKIKDAEELDYFAYINSNIGGLKTNSEISDEINHQITMDLDGKITHKVELKRKHLAIKDANINYAYLRFYLPLGSKIIEVKNFEKKDSIRRDTFTGMIYLEEREDKYLGKAEIKDMDIYEESGKTVIGGWQVIRPGEELLSEISYKLPNNIDIKNEAYKIIIQKQSGIVKQTTNININDISNKKGASISFDLKKDEFMSIPLK